ncbi:MAG TPA: DNA polymerase III subunit gamma/tau [Candidatus Limnocylindrales bacterium]|nr:DNA polymerase III subunit gamma/tau [Candidatus Limnocylindrales bacterium]
MTQPHQALYRRWRAQTFSQIVGQEPVVATLRNAVRANRVAHALLFVGPRGTGKTSMARIVAKALNCTNLQDGEPCDTCQSCVAIREGRALDVAELDAASNNKVDDIRELLRAVATTPSDLRRKVFIIDEVQRIREGWDVLLKTLEEPPEHVAFIFCTTDSSQIRPAVMSRLQRFDFRRLSVPQIEGKLRAILAADGRAASDEAIRLVAEQAAGGMRDAESILDQLLSAGDDTIDESFVRDLLGLAEAGAVAGFVDAMAAPDPLAGLAILDELDERGRDLRVFLDQVVDEVRRELVAALGGPPTPRIDALAAAARSLAGIDPTSLGAGGLRLQLELVLLARPSTTERSGSPGAVAAAPQPAAPQPLPVEATAPEPGPKRRGRPAPPANAAPPAPPASAATPAAPATPTTPATAASDASPTPPSEAAAIAASTSPGSPELDRLLAGWRELVAELGQHPPTKALLAEARPIAIDANVVTLGFPETKAFLKDIAERRRTSLEEGIGRFLGRPVAVRCVATNLDVFAPLPEDPDRDRLLTEARRIFADDLVDVGEVS